MPLFYFAAFMSLAAGTGLAEEFGDPAIEMMGTRLTRLSLNAEGTRVLERRFDESGQLVEWVLTDRTSNPVVKDVYRTTGNPETRVREKYLGKNLVRRATERLNSREALLSREVEWSESGKGALDHLRVEKPSKAGLDVSVFVVSGTRKSLISHHESQVLSLLFDPKAPTNFRPLEGYSMCLSASKGSKALDSAECRSNLEDLVIGQRLKALKPETFASLECRAGDDLYLAEGYRIDTRSCQGKALDAARAAAKQSASMVSCLGKVNSMMALNFAMKLSEVRPRIRCGSSDTFDKTTLPNCDPGWVGYDAARCAENTEHLTKVGAYAAESVRPGDIFLGKNDPTTNTGMQNLNDGDALNRQLGPTIFHETIHLCTHKGCKHHSDSDADVSDEVYGCQALCGGEESAAYASAEGCRACVNGFPADDVPKPKDMIQGHNPAPNATLLAKCDSLPPAKVMNAMRSAQRLSDLAINCERTYSTSVLSAECLLLKQSPEFAACTQELDAAAKASGFALSGLNGPNGDPDIRLGFRRGCIDWFKKKAGAKIVAVWNDPGRARAIEYMTRGKFPVVGDGTLKLDEAKGCVKTGVGSGGTTLAIHIEGRTETSCVESRQAALSVLLLDSFCAEVNSANLAKMRTRYAGVKTPMVLRLNVCRGASTHRLTCDDTGGQPIMDPAYVPDPNAAKEAARVELFCGRFHDRRDRLAGTIAPLGTD